MNNRVRIGQRWILLVLQRQLLNYIRRDREIWDPVAQEGWYIKLTPPCSNAKSAEIFHHRFIGLFYRYFHCMSLLKWIRCWHNGPWRIYYGQQFTGVYDIMLCELWHLVEYKVYRSSMDIILVFVQFYYKHSVFSVFVSYIFPWC